MDKLEIDARLAKVERSVSRLRVAVTLGLLAIAVAAVMVMRTAATRRSIADPTASVVESPTPSSWTVGELERELRKVHDLMNEAIISLPQRDAKKADLLAKPLRFGDLKDDLTRVQSMYADGIISVPEAGRLKEVILKGER